MKKNVIVSLADSNYFNLLNELVDSIKSFEESKNIAICILDAGLDENQKKILSKKVDDIKYAEWHIKIPKYKTLGKEWLKSMTARVYLPNYFPNYENFIWIEKNELVKLSNIMSNLQLVAISKLIAVKASIFTSWLTSISNCAPASFNNNSISVR